MVCKSCCQEDKKKKKYKRGLWSPEEDRILRSYVLKYGHGYWSEVPKKTGLERCGKSCRLRWINYLRPGLKRGAFSHQEQMIIINAHAIMGNRWSQIATMLPGRTDNEIKNFWHSHLKKYLTILGIDPNAHRPLGDCTRKETLEFSSSTNSSIMLPDDLQINFISNGELNSEQTSISGLPMELTIPVNCTTMQPETAGFEHVEPKPGSECFPGDSSFLDVMFSEWFYSEQNHQNSTINMGSQKLVQMCPQSNIDSQDSSCISYQQSELFAEIEEYPLPQVISTESSDGSNNSLSWGSFSEGSLPCDGSVLCNEFSTSSANTNTISSADYWGEGSMGRYSDLNLGMDDNPNLFEKWSFLDMDFC